MSLSLLAYSSLFSLKVFRDLIIMTNMENLTLIRHYYVINKIAAGRTHQWSHHEINALVTGSWLGGQFSSQEQAVELGRPLL